MRDHLEEIRALGARGLAFRVGWEARMRWLGFSPAHPSTLPSGLSSEWTRRLFWPDAATVADRVGPHMPPAAIDRLLVEATSGLDGRVLCFRRWWGEFGDPPDWSKNPTNGARWPSVPWWQVLTHEPEVGDVKLTWEIGRFPHAYAAARAAAHLPAHREALGARLLAQLRHFNQENPVGTGVHWQSGQEVAFRLFAWVFACDTLLSHTARRDEASALVGDALAIGAAHVASHVSYARWAVYNNHLLSEALLLYMAGVLLADLPDAQAWRACGRSLLDEGVERQFYGDGGYIQQSHTYHRVALQLLILAVQTARAHGDGDAPAWLAAIERSVTFLHAAQNPADGWLPNYGGNDGALPLVLSTCDFPDFRPTLQAASVLSRGERLYPPGPWDEELAWSLGPAALDAPLAAPPRVSVSFAETGHHLLRSPTADAFLTFRCGTLRDRFTQIDMHHVGLWWRSRNVLCDAGSYQYNGSDRWHHHFCAGATHNAITIDGTEPMRHHRRFKFLYPPNARLVAFDAVGGRIVGEHDGFVRERRCMHRRTALQLGEELWVVIDDVHEVDGGEGVHAVRLHWLAGGATGAAPTPADLPAPWAIDSDGAGLHADFPEGPFALRVASEAGLPIPGDAVAGMDEPGKEPRGWLSRYYAEKTPTPSFAVVARGAGPIRLFTAMGTGPITLTPGDRPLVTSPGGTWRIDCAQGVAERVA